jgi:hypothetical protein
MGPALVFLVLALALLWLHLLRLRFPLLGQDEGILLAYPDLILRGYVPNRDFATLYPPGAFWSVAIAFRLVGETLDVERAVGLLFQISILAAVIQIARQYGTVACLLAGLGVCTGIALFVPGANSVLGGIACGFWAIALSERGFGKSGSVRIFACGVLTGLAFLFRQDVGLAAAAAVAPYLLRNRTGAAALAYGAGLGAGLLPLLAHLVQAGIGPVFENLVLDVIRNAPGRALPIQADALYLIVIPQLAILLCAALLAARKRGGALPRALTLFSLCFLPSILQRVDAWHVGYGAIVLLPSAAIMLAIAAQGAMPDRLRGAPELLMIPVAALGWIHLLHAKTLWFILPTAETMFGHTIGRFEGEPVSIGRRSVLVAREDHREFRAIAAALAELPAGARLFVGPEDLRRTISNEPMLYFLTPHLSAPYHIEMNPGVADRPGSRLAGDIATADYLLLKSGGDSGSPGSPVPNLLVRQHFCPAQSLGHYRLLRRCKPAS